MGRGKCLGRLIVQLVDEVALRGKAGALPSEIITHIKRYYSEPSRDDSQAPEEEVSPVLLSDDTPPTLDSAFLEYIWRLLIRDPEIRLGEHDQYKQSTLAEAEASHGSARVQQLTGEALAVTAPAFAARSNHASEAALTTHRQATQRQILEDSPTGDRPATAGAPPNPEGAKPLTDNHSPTPPAQPKTVAVAAINERGIRLFATESRIWRTIAGHDPDNTRIPSLDFVCLSIIAACGPQGIPQNDLVRVSGQDKRSLPTRTDRLHKNGYIVKRPATVVHNQVLTHTSLLTLKRFAVLSGTTPAELMEAARGNQKGIKTKSKCSTTETSALLQEEGQGAGDAFSQEVPQINENASPYGAPMANPVPQWTPDRNLFNQIFDIVHHSGAEGTTSSGVSTSLMGPDYRRPIEDLLAKLTNAWQSSQPLHLRHLVIVRDSLQRGKSSVYVYYTFENYKRLVDAGQKTWEAVLMLQDSKKSTNATIPSVDARRELDQYHFPNLDPSQFQDHCHDASLSECISATGASFGSVNAGTPERSKTNISPGSTRESISVTVKASSKQKVTASVETPSKSIAVRKGVGRPRKYLTTGIPGDIDSWNVDDIKGLIESRRMSDKYQKIKITNEIKRRMQMGEEAVFVTHQLLEATDALRKEQGEQPMSKFLVMQILHEYAGGAEPPEEDDTTTALRRMLKEADHVKHPRGKWPRTGRPPSVPSTPNDGRPVLPSGGTQTTGLESVGIRTRRPPKTFDESPILRDAIVKQAREKISQKRQKDVGSYRYLPSIAAHSQLHYYIPIMNAEMRAQTNGSLYWHLPSVAAHSTPHHAIPFTAVAGNQIWQKTKNKKLGRPRKIVDVNLESATELPASKRRKVATSSIHDGSIITGPPPSTSSLATAMEETSQPSSPMYKPSPWMMHKIMSEKYEKTVESTLRPNHGIFVAKAAQRYKRRDDPVSITTKTYQVAIFKLSALRGLHWFVNDQPVAQSGGSMHHQRQEQANKTQDQGNFVSKYSGLRNLPWLVEHSQSGSSEVRPSPPSQDGATDPQFRVISDGPMTPQTVAEESDDTAVTIATATSCQTRGAHQQIGLSKSLKPFKKPSSATSVPTLGKVQTTRSPPRLGTFAHRGPLPQMRPAHLRSSEAPHALLSATTSGCTSKARNPPVEENLGSKSSRLDAGLRATDSNLPLKVHVPEESSNNPLSIAHVQDPTNFVFKFASLRNLDWFRPRPSIESGDGHILSHGQEILPTWRASPRPAPVLGNISSNALYYKAPTMDEQRSVVINHVPTPLNSRDIRKSVRTGGSTAILRRDIVIDLVQKSGGVFPEASAMRIPFGHEWRARGQSGVPERNTVVNAVNMCCEQGKLRRFIFSFKGHHGITSTSTVFALPNIDSGDPRVKETQEMIKKRHPQMFVPDAVMPKDPLIADTRKLKRQQTLEEAADKQARIDEAKAMALKSPEERDAYLTALQLSDRSEQEKTALSRFAEPSTRKLQRLGTIRKPATSRLPLPASTEVQANGTLPGGQLTLLSQDNVLLENNSHTLRPSHVQTNEFLVQSEQSRQRMRELANNAVQIERNQKKKDRESLYLPHGGFHQLSHTSKEYIVSGFMDPVIQKHDTSGTFSASFSGIRIAKASTKLPPGVRKRRRTETDEPVFPGFMDPILMYHRSTGTFSASFPGYRVGMIKFNQRGKRKCNSKATIPLGYKSPLPSRNAEDKLPIPLQNVDNEPPRFPGVMSPDVLHPLSGTFSARFLGFSIDKAQVGEARSSRRTRRPYSKYKKRATDSEEFMAVNSPSGYSRKRRHTDHMTETRVLDELTEPSLDPMIGRPFKLRRVRGPQKTKSMGENGALRLFVAVMVIRLLTGGLRMTIDWSLVAKVFAPVHDENFIRSRWSSVLAKMRHNQVKMDADFQTLFARAYKEGAVPKLDFEHLADYDWKWLVEWTIGHLDTPTDSAPELMADRSDFNQRYVLKEASQEKDLTHFYEFEGFSVKDLRTSVINRQAYVCHLFPRISSFGHSETSSENEQIAIARSWIRANILTPAETYDSQAARAKLNTLPEHTVEAALKSLLQEKAVAERYKNRMVPGRDYEMSDHFEKRLRTNISPTQFHRAAAFKSQLDQALDIEGRARWSYLADDGTAMAVLNLLANRRVQIEPIDPPLNKWGHTDDGYATRQMDKSKLNFEMDIIPTSQYIVGLPLEPLPPPPAPHLNEADQQPKRIPVWYDINDDLVSGMWMSTLGAVLGLLAVRTGATAAELQVNLRPSLEIWEVEEILAWMVRAEVAEKVGKEGYMIKEWWWMALGQATEADLV